MEKLSKAKVSITNPYGVPHFHITGSFGECEITALGAQVNMWKPAGQEHSVLWQSPFAIITGQAHRAGLQRVAPYFQHGLNGDQEPLHGPARLQVWDFVGQESDSKSISLKFRLSDQTWQGSTLTYETTIQITLNGLFVNWTTENTGTCSMGVEKVFHSYFGVSSRSNVTISGLRGAPVLDMREPKADRMIEDQDHILLTGSNEVCKLYQHDSSVVINDRGFKRKVELVTYNSPHKVLWTPGEEKALATPDIGMSWDNVLCLESGFVKDEARLIAPGKSLIIGLQLKCTNE